MSTADWWFVAAYGVYVMTFSALAFGIGFFGWKVSQRIGRQ